MALKIYITNDYDSMSQQAAHILIPQMAAKTIQQQDFFNLGLATGNSPVGLYKLIVERQSQFNAKKTRSWNLDEYVGLPGATASVRALHPESYAYFMIQNLFGKLDPHFAETYVPTGTEIDQKLLEAFLGDAKGVKLEGTDAGKAVVIQPGCSNYYLRGIRNNILNAYTRSIKEAGGVDWWVVGSGSKGHIAFHEAGIPLEYEIMLVKLAESTINDAVAAEHFISPEEAPHYAISMGAEGVVNLARNVLLVANGESKRDPIAKALFDNESADVPISILQRYRQMDGDAIFVLDEEAAAEILRNEKNLRQKGIEVNDVRG